MNFVLKSSVYLILALTSMVILSSPIYAIIYDEADQQFLKKIGCQGAKDFGPRKLVSDLYRLRQQKNCLAKYWGQSVAAQMSSRDLISEDRIQLSTDLVERFGLPLCPINPINDSLKDGDSISRLFASISEEKIFAGCSSFLIGPNLLLTAGHCLRPSPEEVCQQDIWAFSQNLKDSKNLLIQRNLTSRLENESELRSEIENEDIYRCKKVSFFRFGNYENPLNEDQMIKEDWAVIELDRAVRGRPVLKLAKNLQDQSAHSLATIGHSLGLDLQVAEVTKLQDHYSNLGRYRFQVDHFAGNSGAPLIDLSNGLVYGVVVSGRKDWFSQKFDNQDCLSPNICRNQNDDVVCDAPKDVLCLNEGRLCRELPGALGEEAMHSFYIFQKIKNYLKNHK